MTSNKQDPQGSPQGPHDSTAHDSPPSIVVTARQLNEITVDAVEAMEMANRPEPVIFVSGTELVRLQAGSGRPHLENIDRDRLRNYLAKVANWFSVKQNQTLVPVSPPMTVIANVLAEPQLPFPPVDRAVSAPVFGRDGSVNIEPGYHPSSRTIFCPPSGLKLSSVTDSPTPDEVRLAKAMIMREALGDFPFVSDADQAHAVAAMLLPFVRSMIGGPTPLMLISAPARGTGKTLLAQCLIHPIAGADHGMITGARGDEEWKKKIGAVLSAGPPVVALDNLTGWLGSPHLASVLTATTWSDRLLGRNDRIIHYPNQALWLGTANNANLSDEMVRRTVPIHLDAQTEKPYERDAEDFRHPDLEAWVRQHRGFLVWSCLILGRAWVSNGRPSGGTVIGSFEDWSRVMGGILDVANIPGFLDNIGEFRADVDTETEMWGSFVEAWYAEYGSTPIRVATLLEVYRRGDDFLNLGRYNRTERGEATALGGRLLKRKNAIYAGFRLDNPGTQQGGNLWRLVPVADSNKKGSER